MAKMKDMGIVTRKSTKERERALPQGPGTLAYERAQSLAKGAGKGKKGSSGSKKGR